MNTATRSGRGKRPPKRKKSGTSTKKVIVEFSGELLTLTERAASSLSTDRSKLIRLAVEHFLNSLQRRELERELAEGYRANAGLDRQISEDFAWVDGEGV